MKILTAVFAVVFGFGGLAKAGILFEPSVGYESGSLIFTDANDLQNKFTNTSLDGGLRLGIRNMGFWIGVEGLAATGGKSKPESGADKSYNGTTFFASMGYDFSSRFRLVGGYGFQDSVVIKDDAGLEATYYGGAAAKVGLGFYLFPHAALNVDYVLRDYKKYKINGVEHSITDLGGKSLRTSTVLVTLSFPVTF